MKVFSPVLGAMWVRSGFGQDFLGKPKANPYNRAVGESSTSVGSSISWQESTMNAMENLRKPLDVEFLHRELVESGPYERLEYREQTDSTNTDLVKLAQTGAVAWTAALTEYQSAGRGRMGRSFTAPPSSQLPMSVLIRPPREAVSRLGTMPLAAGLALIDAIGSPEIKLKWPNDLVIDGRKLCGILAEAVSLGAEPAVVIGMGLNTSLRQDELPVPHASSLLLEGIPFERNELAVKILKAVYRRLNQWQNNDPQLLDDYRAVSATIGEDVRVVLPDNTELLGVAESVGDDGRIEVRDAHGALHQLTAGDVTHLRLQH